MGDSKSPESFEHAVRYVPPTALVVYGVTDADLDQFARGGSSQVYLAFALTLLGSASSLLVVLLSVQLSDRAFAGFLSALLITAVGGTLLLALWRRAHVAVSDLVGEIKRRPFAATGELVGSVEPDAT